MRLIYSIALCLGICAATPTLANEAPIHQGAWSLGGTLAFPFEYNKYRVSSFGFSIKPEASYFVLDGLELTLGTTLSNVLSYDYLTPPRQEKLGNLYWGLKLGTHYFFQTQSNILPYAGAEFGVLMVEWEFKQIVWYLRIPVGVMWFLRPNIALDFGIPFSLDFSSTAVFEKFTISPGYFGLRAFF